ncbi:MAG: hypothetical protein F6K28_56200 [Microcoleus sp. SIO2G3]|nr:hypothetical protein [Microcoleus sp. SIO2G3]
MPPSLAPSSSGLPASRPEVAGATSPYSSAPVPSIAPIAPTSVPQSIPGQPIGNGNTFSNP